MIEEGLSQNKWEEMKKMFLKPDDRSAYMLHMEEVREKIKGLEIDLDLYTAIRDELRRRLYTIYTGIGVGSRVSLGKDTGTVVRLDCSLPYLCPVVVFETHEFPMEMFVNIGLREKLEIIK